MPSSTAKLDPRIAAAKAAIAPPAILDALTPKQRRFVEEYPIDLNAAAAARRAGYSANCAAGTGFDLLRHPTIIEAMAAVLVKRSKQSGVDRAWVLTNLVESHEEASKNKTLNGLDRRLKALELIGRHVDIRAFRIGLGMPGGPTDTGAQEDWDLSLLSDEEFSTFERLLAKVTVERPHGGGEDSASEAQ